jgi:hypothetical protein
MTEFGGRSADQKVLSRVELVQRARRILGGPSVPKDRQYWTLCSVQDASPRSELGQLSRAGFLKPEQFHGVDRNAKVIQANRRRHPQAHWHEGDWEDVLNAAVLAGEFRPAVVNLDTMCHSGGPELARLVRATMTRVPDGVPVFVNAVTRDPRSRKTMDMLDRIDSHLSERECSQWGLRGAIECFTYLNSGSKLTMTTYILKKGKKNAQEQPDGGHEKPDAGAHMLQAGGDRGRPPGGQGRLEPGQVDRGVERGP